MDDSVESAREFQPSFKHEHDFEIALFLKYILVEDGAIFVIVCLTFCYGCQLNEILGQSEGVPIKPTRPNAYKLHKRMAQDVGRVNVSNDTVN